MPQSNHRIFGIGIQGRSPAASAQSRVNAYVDIDPQGERKSRFTIYGLPGLTQFANLGDTPIRGMHSLGPYLYVAHRDQLYQIRNDGQINGGVALGTLDTTSGRVGFDDNGSGNYLVLVDGTSGYTFAPATDTFASISDVDFPASPATVAFLQGYFAVGNDGAEQFDISALDDPTTWPGDFDLAYADPDELVRVYDLGGLLVLLGARSMEYWGYTGAAAFPYERVAQSQYHWGLAARHSVATVNGMGYGLMRRQEGGLGVCRFGGPVEMVSTPEMCAQFDAYEANGAVDDAVGSAFSVAGHPFYQLHFPLAGATWLYDALTGLWSRRQSYGLQHYRGVQCVHHQGDYYWTDYDQGIIWKASQPVIRPDKSVDWSSVVWIEGTDDNNNDRPVPFQVTGEHLFVDGNRTFTVRSLELDMETGLGTTSGQGANPKVMLQISGDRGHSWGNELHATLGLTGQYSERVRFHRLGQYRYFVARITITDPVPRVLVDEALNLTAGAH